jgi:uncharacterized protein (TIRG00374 family)
VCIVLVEMVIMNLRWNEIIKHSVPLPRLQHMQHYFYGTFLNNFTPANLGGDAYRIIALSGHATGKLEVIVGLVRERLLGVLALFGFYLFCLAGSLVGKQAALGDAQTLFVAAGVVTFVAGIGLLLAPAVLDRLATWIEPRLSERFATTLRHCCTAMHLSSSGGFTKLIALSLLTVWLWVLAVQTIAFDLGVHMSWKTLGLIVVLVELIRSVPISIQGIGVREGTYAYLFSRLGEPSEVGFILGMMSYLALSVAIVVAGLVGFGCQIAAKRCAPQVATESVRAGLQPAVGLAPCRNPDIHCETEHAASATLDQG